MPARTSFVGECMVNANHAQARDEKITQRYSYAGGESHYSYPLRFRSNLRSDTSPSNLMQHCFCVAGESH